MIVDYHMHLRNARGEIAHDTWAIDPFVESARVAGVDEIGFTAHIYYFKQTRSLWTVPYHIERCVYDIEAYVSAVVTGVIPAAGLMKMSCQSGAALGPRLLSASKA